MLQQTRVTTVIPYYNTFFRRFPDIKGLAEADSDALLKTWEGLGYYARARNLQKAARIIVDDFNGCIPDTRKELIKLPGIGDYIASAVVSIAFGKPHAVADGNVKRLLSRLFEIEAPVNKQASHRIFKAYAQELIKESDPGAFNQAMMEAGAKLCLPRTPACKACPVRSLCRAFSENRTNELPRRIPRKKVPTFQIAAGIVRKNGKVLITRRKPEGLLGGLWEFPGGKLKENEDAASACIREIHEETGLTVAIDCHLTRVSHAYTHFKIEMDVFYCSHLAGDIRLNGPCDVRWIELEDIPCFAFPKANLKFIPMIESSPTDVAVRSG
jgi:A/G-specific adenine glycosylase